MSYLQPFPLTPFHYLFRKISPKESTESRAELKEETDFTRIRCPLCKWQPNKQSLWCCADCGYPEFYFSGCHTFWNTFETGGVCPRCRHQWRWTSCLECYGWSLHANWYADETE